MRVRNFERRQVAVIRQGIEVETESFHVRRAGRKLPRIVQLGPQKLVNKLFDKNLITGAADLLIAAL